jgi:hypothetical protein
MDKSSQGDDPLLDRYGDVGRVKVGAPLKLFLYISFDLAVGPIHYDLLYLGLIDMSTLQRADVSCKIRKFFQSGARR